MISVVEILKNNGYYNVSSGKFHMGDYARRGFDEVQENREINGQGGESYWITALNNKPENKPFLWFASYDGT